MPLPSPVKWGCAEEFTQQARGCGPLEGLLTRLALGWHPGSYVLEEFPPLTSKCLHSVQFGLNTSFWECGICWGCAMPGRGCLCDQPSTESLGAVSKECPWFETTHMIASLCLCAFPFVSFVRSLSYEHSSVLSHQTYGWSQGSSNITAQDWG